jgi:N-acetylneuraminate synthase
LKNYSHKLDLYFIASPFSHQATDILDEVEVDAFKIASGETTNLPLLEHITSKDKPVLLSTGMSNWREIDNAVKVLSHNLKVLFQCSSQYPCLEENIGLNVIQTMKDRYDEVVIGYSDHTLTNISSIGAFMKGARVFEKHFTLSKKMYGADARFSFEPEEMRDYVLGLAFISKVLKSPVNKDDLNIYKEMKTIFEKSIVAKKDLEEGTILKFEDFDFKKPGDGIRADKYKEIIGKKLNKNLLKNEKFLQRFLDS